MSAQEEEGGLNPGCSLTGHMVLLENHREAKQRKRCGRRIVNQAQHASLCKGHRRLETHVTHESACPHPAPTRQTRVRV